MLGNKRKRVSSTDIENKMNTFQPLPLHLLEMVALTHHRAWFRLCCVSREFAFHSGLEKVELGAACTFSSSVSFLTLAKGVGYITAVERNGVFEERGRESSATQSKRTRIELPSGALHCAEKGACFFVTYLKNDSPSSYKSIWYLFGKKHSPDGTPTEIIYKDNPTNARENHKLLKFFRHGTRINDEKYGYSLCLKRQDDSIWISSFYENGVFKKRIEWLGTGLDNLKKYKETYYTLYNGKYMEGRKEEEGPANITYWRNGKKRKEVYMKGGVISRRKGPPAITAYFGDGKVCAQFFYDGNMLQCLPETQHCISCVAGKNRNYEFLVFVRNPTILQNNMEYTLRDVRSGRMVAALFAYNSRETRFSRVPFKFQYFGHEGDSKCTVKDSFFSFSFNIASEGEYGIHVRRECECIPFLKTMVTYCLKTYRKKATEILCSTDGDLI